MQWNYKGNVLPPGFFQTLIKFCCLFIEHFNTFLCHHKSTVCIGDNYEHGGVVLAEVMFRIWETLFILFVCITLYQIPSSPFVAKFVMSRGTSLNSVGREIIASARDDYDLNFSHSTHNSTLKYVPLECPTSDVGNSPFLPISQPRDHFNNSGWKGKDENWWQRWEETRNFLSHHNQEREDWLFHSDNLNSAGCL